MVESDLKCVIIKSLDDRSRVEICDLLARSFPGNYDDLLRRFTFLISHAPDHRYIVVKNPLGNEIVGVLTLVSRCMPYFGTDLAVTGLSYMAASSSYKSLTITDLLKEKLFEYLEESGDISVGFARKLMDGYWYPYGYVGVTNFGEIRIELSHLRKSRCDFSVVELSLPDLEIVSDLYLDAYQNSLGSFKRDKKMWEFYLERMKETTDSKRIMLVRIERRPVAYFVIDENQILEVSCEREILPEIVFIIGDQVRNVSNKYKEVIFEISFTHPMVRYLSLMPHRKSSRFVWNGGHILKILDLKRLLNKIAPILESRLRRSQIPSFSLSLNNIQFDFRLSNLSIKENCGASANCEISEIDWVKLVFGVLDAAEILPSSCEGEFVHIFKTMFPVASTQFPALDHF